MDVVRPDDDPAKFTFLERQFVDFLTESDPTVRSPTFASLEEAIQAFDARFGNGPPRQ